MTISSTSMEPRQPAPDADDRLQEAIPAGPDPAQALPRVGATTIALIGLSLVLVIGGAFLLGYLPYLERQRTLEEEVRRVKDRIPVVEAFHPEREARITELRLPGDVRPKQSTSIHSRTSGYLKKLYVDIGERVKGGQLLAEIEAPEVDAELGRARAALEQARADHEKATADRDLAQSTLDRFNGFSLEGGVTKQQLDEKRFALQQAQAALAAAKAKVSAAQAEVDRLSKLQEFQKIQAPFDGIVTHRALDVGTLLEADNTDAGKELFQIAMTNPLRIFVDVPQVYMGLIRDNSTAEVEIRNFPGRTFRGAVMRSTGEVDSTTRTLKFLVLVQNDEGLLYPGMYAQVRFRIDSDAPPLTVPSTALVFGSEGPSVALLRDDVVHFQKVTLGRDLGARVQVLEGISPDDLVIGNPGERLAEGVKARLAKRSTAGKAP